MAWRFYLSLLVGSNLPSTTFGEDLESAWQTGTTIGIKGDERPCFTIEQYIETSTW